MSTHEPAQSVTSAKPLADGVFDVLAVLLLFLAYLVVLWVTRNDGEGGGLSALAALVNITPLVLLGAAVRVVLTRHVIGRKPALQLAAHVTLATLFTLLWYWLLMVLMGFVKGEAVTRFTVRPFFPNPALAWQLLQGLTFYALIAALAYVRAQSRLPRLVVTGASPAADAEKGPSLSRYFIRRGEEIYPVEISQIISISGADDYAEVMTPEGRHLVRMTLAEFESVLDGGPFIRVHRSRIVNVDRIQRAEPAGGGRLLLHMDNGEMIPASRAGSKLLRDRVI